MEQELSDARPATDMEPSDSDSEPHNDVLQLDLLQLRMALGKASQKVFVFAADTSTVTCSVLSQIDAISGPD